jgi:RNA polymerase sigma-54 factor
MGSALAMSPRLQQAIQCLGMSNLELSEYLEDIVQSNPFVMRSRPSGVASSQADRMYQTDWSEISDPRDIQPSLHQFFGQQLDQAALPSAEKAIAQYLIGCVDDDGYLRETIEDLSKRLGIAPAVLDDVVKTLQDFDPPGVMARTLGECLEQQLIRQGVMTESVKVCLKQLGERAIVPTSAFDKLCRENDLNLHECRDMSAKLDPHPGRRYSEHFRRLGPPDVLLVVVQGGGWELRLNDANLPRPLLDRDFVTQISRETESAVYQEEPSDRSIMSFK